MNTGHNIQPRWWDLPAAIIVLAAVLLTTVRLTATNWTDELPIIQTISLFAVLSGMALGQSTFSPRVSGLFSAGYAGFSIFWQLGLMFGEGVIWAERLSSLIGRLGYSFENLFRQRAVTDPVLFLFLMAVLFWLLAAHAGYTLTRYANAWRALLPIGVSLFIIHIHDVFWTNRSWFLAVYIFLALLLAARTNFLHKRSEWRRTRTHMPPFVGLDFLRITMAVSGILILLAWTAPAMAAYLPPAQEAWYVVSRPWYEARSRMSNAFASLRASVTVAQDYYGDVLPLGRGNTLTDSIIFTVDAPPRPAAGIRYYWRDRIYETWNGTGWNADPTEYIRVQPDKAALLLPNLEGRWDAEFTFTSYTTLNTLQAVPQPLWVSRPSTAELFLSPDGVADVLRLSVSPSIRPGEQYRVLSSLTNATEAELRAAPDVYPDFISERYLQMPDTITSRTRSLAEEITAEFDNPYDKVVAVTQWLRDSITYQETMPIPPRNQDIIDWMLFDVRQGFCNYYATAEVMMLRSLGIPSRLAVGYAQGQRDPATNTYTIRQRDAHAWPEVYFPGIGWVEFEPTINQRPLRRPPGDPVIEDNTASPAGGSRNTEFPERESPPEAQTDRDLPVLDDVTAAPEDPPEIVRNVSWGWVLPATALVTLLGSIVWYRNRVTDPKSPITPISVRIETGLSKTRLPPPAFLTRMARKARHPFEARAYDQINRSLRWLKHPQTLSKTPAERAAALADLLPESRETIQLLLQNYHATVFRARLGLGSTAETRMTSTQAAKKLRRQTVKDIFRKYFARVLDPSHREAAY